MFLVTGGARDAGAERVKPKAVDVLPVDHHQRVARRDRPRLFGVDRVSAGVDTASAALSSPTDALSNPTDALFTPTEALSTPTDALPTPTDALYTPTDALSCQRVAGRDRPRLFRRIARQFHMDGCSS